MKSSDAIRTLCGIRFLLGSSTWLTPRFAGTMMGLDPRVNESAPYLGRLFAARDVVLGVGAAQSSGDVQRQWLTFGVAVDAADFLAAVAAIRKGELGGRGAVAGVGIAAAATALGVLALNGDGAG